MANLFKKKDSGDNTITVTATEHAMGYRGGFTFHDPFASIASAVDNNMNKPRNKEDQWIWVEGYKGTNADMTCRDHKFELGVQYDIPEDEEIVECERGYHLCLKLEDVFGYYNIIGNNRFFKVKALVRQSDVDMYGKYKTDGWYTSGRIDKLAARSIILESEVSKEELYSAMRTYDCRYKPLSDHHLEIAIKSGIDHAVSIYRINTLIADGYSRAFAEYISYNDDRFECAHALASLEGLSMDVKVMQIMRED